MNIEQIKSLLARFYEGQTTPDEERLLADFFRQDNIPDELKADRQLFLGLQEIADTPMPEDIAAEIDTFVMNLAEEPAKKSDTASRPRLIILGKLRTPPRILYRVAATATILLALGGGIWNYQSRVAPYKDTCANAEEAAAQIQRANSMIAKATEQCMAPASKALQQADAAKQVINQYINF